MSETRRVVLPPRSEYRFELDAGEALSVRLVADPITGRRGDAEVFGMSLSTGGQEKWHTFGHEVRASINSWGGAEIEIAGSASTEYLADEQSPMFTYGANLHLHLERLRLRAREQLRTDSALQSQLAALDVESANVPAPGDQESVYRANGQGPRVMVVGPESAGKTSLIKFLANYALRSPAVASVSDSNTARRLTRRDAEDHSEDEAEPEDTDGLSDITGWWPVIVALDPSEGAVPLPGCMSALPLSPLPMTSLPSPSPAVPYGVTLQTSGSLPPSVSSVQSVVPLIHWLGRHNVRENEQHSRRVVDWLAHGVEKRLAKDLRARMSGLLIDMPGTVTADGRTRYSFIQYVAKAFKADMIVVLGHEKLTLELQRIYGADPQAPQVVKMPKSGGAVEADEVYKQRVQDMQVRSYFYGLGALQPDEDGASRATVPGHSEPLGGVPTLNPYSTTIPIDLLDIYRVGQDRVAPSSALPIGATRVLSEIQVVKLDLENSSSDLSSLMHSVLAIIDKPAAKGTDESGNAAQVPEDELVGAAVIGFIHISDIDHTRRKLTVLSPRSGKLPSTTAYIGDY
ncbi:polynucleotide 5'-hydroxyl-kinase [Malassezia cuniculi]|uniref:Polynucleotide 5'-hydroxyl-kinase GRC3 n=1 Tax=Malassezia cuniculi TaxID=948313 RepID=A0AAF0EVU6_9BASI|nr:polynucleotide 5'-hydroxyl-kinase [Malassezia cuniculi]